MLLIICATLKQISNVIAKYTYAIMHLHNGHCTYSYTRQNHMKGWQSRWHQMPSFLHHFVSFVVWCNLLCNPFEELVSDTSKCAKFTWKCNERCPRPWSSCYLTDPIDSIWFREMQRDPSLLKTPLGCAHIVNLIMYCCCWFERFKFVMHFIFSSVGSVVSGHQNSKLDTQIMCVCNKRTTLDAD